MWSFGATGKVLKDVVVVGIGGCFLGPLFVHTVLQTGWVLQSLMCTTSMLSFFCDNVIILLLKFLKPVVQKAQLTCSWFSGCILQMQRISNLQGDASYVCEC